MPIRHNLVRDILPDFSRVSLLSTTREALRLPVVESAIYDDFLSTNRETIPLSRKDHVMCDPTTGVRSEAANVLFCAVKFRATQGGKGTGAHVRIRQQIRKESGSLDREWVEAQTSPHLNRE
jgi:hypothetical protein